MSLIAAPGSACPICMDPFGPVRVPFSTLCGHIFCEGCIDRWRVSCPICRSGRQGIVELHVDFADPEFEAQRLQNAITDFVNHGAKESQELQRLVSDCIEVFRDKPPEWFRDLRVSCRMVAFIYNIRTETFELEDEQRRLRQRNHQLENEMALLENENGQLRQQQLTLERLVDRCAREHDRTASYTEEHSHYTHTVVPLQLANFPILLEQQLDNVPGLSSRSSPPIQPASRSSSPHRLYPSVHDQRNEVLSPLDELPFSFERGLA